MNDRNGNGVPDEIEQPEEEFEWKERKRLLFFGLPFTFTVYTLSPKKLELKTGFFTTVINDILLYRVMDTTLSRNLLQKLFGLGSVQVVSSDKTHPNLCVHNIRNASRWNASGFACASAPANTSTTTGRRRQSLLNNRRRQKADVPERRGPGSFPVPSVFSGASAAGFRPLPGPAARVFCRGQARAGAFPHRMERTPAHGCAGVQVRGPAVSCRS